MKKSTLFILTLCSVSSITYANNFHERDPEQTKIKTTSDLDINTLQTDLLRQEKLSTEVEKNTNKQEYLRYTGRQLVENPEILEKLIVDALVTPNKSILPGYIKLYRNVPNADQSLIDWANAILLRDSDLNKSIDVYRKLISHFPDNHFIRYQLAETLFYNQEFEAAKSQFEKLRVIKTISPKDIEVFDRFINAINNKEEWNFSFGATFLNDKNLANSAKEGTEVILPNGATVVYNTKRQSGQGIMSWFSANKQWNINSGKYIAFESSFSNKYYWDNKSYNDLNAYVGLGIGYSDARFNIQLTPYTSKRWYAGGLNYGGSLKRYSSTYGANLSTSYWLTQKLKYSFSYNYGYDTYDRDVYDNQYRGSSHFLTNSIMYLPSTTQFWSLAIDLSDKEAKDRTNAYKRIGTRLTWGKEWPLGIATSATLGLGKRNYKEISFFGSKQKDKEYSASVTLWHKAVHFAGFTPRLTYTYTKTDSNIPIYSYYKNQLLFDVSKSF
ncbi:surface lipoprotein assembly modifier [Rodentibacter caecimuris]|uniref:DUF560 domain-containing protein n=3 Tax=Rodentibacter caecimuris TaxID=1796644 RepID=A0AAJ3K4U1_9PAST|nr:MULTISPECIES: surface lipoprotein assembly modifier [Pasteurellaceae]AOF53595.1 TPR repeat protein [Pasteurellaceae bacterium NI1060]MCQ9124261.1 DUF560 domain-containing protein [Rodentibacter heylii]MCR1837670.1 surface lipoprotein assembly modifier [Pasteurella caecimuris]MCU0106646.1 surface lipoprotein assembly modifier [Pasteurella caecimuris]OOF72037.1 hypothetical protein BKG90_05925 [Rodentibacter heylii]